MDDLEERDGSETTEGYCTKCEEGDRCICKHVEHPPVEYKEYLRVFYHFRITLCIVCIASALTLGSHITVSQHNKTRLAQLQTVHRVLALLATENPEPDFPEFAPFTLEDIRHLPPDTILALYPEIDFISLYEQLREKDKDL